MNKPIDISGTTLTTERLVLRPWRIEDLDDFFEYASVDGVGQMAGWLPHDSKETSLKVLTGFIEGKKTFALEYNGKVIGSLGIEKYKEELASEYDNLLGREIGYVLSKEYWGQGLMPEAVQEVIRYLFEDEKLDVIFSSFFKHNRQSARVQEKCGFRFYKEVLHTTRYGTQEETNMNILTHEDWMSNR